MPQFYQAMCSHDENSLTKHKPVRIQVSENNWFINVNLNPVLNLLNE